MGSWKQTAKINISSNWSKHALFRHYFTSTLKLPFHQLSLQTNTSPWCLIIFKLWDSVGLSYAIWCGWLHQELNKPCILPLNGNYFFPFLFQSSSQAPTYFKLIKPNSHQELPTPNVHTLHPPKNWPIHNLTPLIYSTPIVSMSWSLSLVYCISILYFPPISHPSTPTPITDLFCVLKLEGTLPDAPVRLYYQIAESNRSNTHTCTKCYIKAYPTNAPITHHHSEDT